MWAVNRIVCGKEPGSVTAIIPPFKNVILPSSKARRENLAIMQARPTTAVLTASSDPPLAFGSRRMTSSGRLGCAAAHKVHDLETVAIPELGRGPGIAPDDVMVQFNSDSIGLDAQLLHQRGQGELVVEAALSTIDKKLHQEHCRRSCRREKHFESKNRIVRETIQIVSSVS